MQRASGEPPACSTAGFGRLRRQSVRPGRPAMRARRWRSAARPSIWRPAQACAPSYLFGLIVTATLALPDGTTPLTPEELKPARPGLHRSGARWSPVPDGDVDAPAPGRTDVQISACPRARGGSTNLFLWSGPDPGGIRALSGAAGTIHLFKDPRGASTFAPSALNPE